ncbi:MAG: octaprenyl diphosphate synthase [Acidiferrobacterales bacterium]|nr:octaprenyl diphosphate synthase [Acidiferrobacterales bacterium]
MNHPGTAAASNEIHAADSKAVSSQHLDSNTTSFTEPDQLLDLAVSLAHQDMEQVNETIQKRLDSDIVLIKTLGAYVVKSGGKRMRPLILLLCARACGYQGNQHITLAAVVEFIHTATLLHDDVVDSSSMRRGQPSANDVWGNEASVLVGDFLYSRAFEMMVETDLMAVMQIMSSTTNAIAEGEVLQLLNAHSPDTTEQAYLDTIHRKTAKLFESAAWLGGVVSGQDDTICKALSEYGVFLGTAFQLVDDVMDYLSTSEEMGKDVGDDLAEGKPTLPLIKAMENGSPEQVEVVRKAIETGDRDQIEPILQIVKDTGAIDYTMKCAKQESEKAIGSLNSLPDSDYKQALINLALFSVARNH